MTTSHTNPDYKMTSKETEVICPKGFDPSKLTTTGSHTDPELDNKPDNTIRPIQKCSVISEQHTWVPTTGAGKQCYSCPMCDQRIYWSNIVKEWIKVTPKRSKF